MIVVPVRQPLVYRVRRLVVLALLVVCGLILVGSVVAWVSAYQSPTRIDQQHPYYWQNRTAIFLANPAGVLVTCTLTVRGADPQTVRLPGSVDFVVSGREVASPAARPATVSCDDRVTVSSGPVLMLYPLVSRSDVLALAIVFPFVVGIYRWRERHGIDAAERMWRAGRYLTRRRDRLR